MEANQILNFLPRSRTISMLLFLACVAMMAAALYMEHQMNLDPCPLCIVQRIMVIGVGLTALVAVLHNPGVTGIRIYGGIVVLFSGLGAGTAMRQLWLQSLPESQVPACGPGLDYLLDVFPLTEVIAMVFAGDGTCAEVSWSLIGISIPGWALLGFAGLIVPGMLQMVRPDPG